MAWVMMSRRDGRRGTALAGFVSEENVPMSTDDGAEDCRTPSFVTINVTTN